MTPPIASYVNTFVRSPFVLNQFGPEKPEQLKSAPPGGPLVESYSQQVEVFVYNAKAGIANGALVTATIAAVACVFSVIGVAFAALTIGASVALRYGAKESLPRIVQNVDTKDIIAVGGGIKTNEPMSKAFGLHRELVCPETGNMVWKPFLTQLWANSLPTRCTSAPRVERHREESTGSFVFVERES